MAPYELRGVREVAQEFGRVQINLTSVDQRTYAYRIMSAVDVQLDRHRVILQHRGPWGEVPILHPRVDYLFDRSGGREAFEEWPDPPPWRCGYAGGIGIGNVRRVLEWARAHEGADLWFAMKRSLRTNHWFDLTSVEAVLEAVSR